MTALHVDVVREFAWAKVNLFLHVTGRRDDGYHLIDSLFVYGVAHDVIEARPAKDLTLDVTGPFSSQLGGSQSGEGHDNLVMRAARMIGARMVGEVTGADKGAALTLVKNLPVASGIGGGSADAAAALRALNRLWGLGLTEPDLCAIAVRIGADVPACVLSQPVRVSGIGEVLEPVPEIPDLHCVLVNPGFALSTPAVFGALKAQGAAFSEPAPPLLVHGDLVDWLSHVRNDLEVPAMQLASDIGSVLDRIMAEPGCLLARMSGSGATCFGLFPDRAHAQTAARTLSATPGWWVAAGVLFGSGQGSGIGSGL
ncbi:MAG: 4-(cytidine 5'-diphospho)-2-C-methyl-D-erythritol kinase [Sphingomonadales bacterium]